MHDSLHDLIHTWRARANEAADFLKRDTSADAHTRYFQHAVMQTYRQAAAELEAVVQPDRDGDGIPDAPVQAPAAVTLTRAQAQALLKNAGLHARELHLHADGALTLIFPRLQPLTQDERVSRLQNADARVTILDMGKLPDTGDPYIDLALIEHEEYP
jgi:hypothetical protein